ncbi:MAG: BofC C-terminal domain-containing protein [Firmicutes bacterium]|nr:BofC C-terminal domain-containing protein [Bacillota bacterium]
MRNVRPFALLLTLSMTLGCFRGYLALFDKGAGEPRQIYPCQVSTLPDADRQALEKGIPVRTEEELNRLLEDFLS